MKKVLFAALLMITSIAAFSQKASKAPFRHEGKVEMRGNFQHRPQFAFHPRPLSDPRNPLISRYPVAKEQMKKEVKKKLFRK